MQKGMKEENSEQRERAAVIDFHMDPKLVSRERGRKRTAQRRKMARKWGQTWFSSCYFPLSVALSFSPAFFLPFFQLFSFDQTLTVRLSFGQSPLWNRRSPAQMQRNERKAKSKQARQMHTWR